MHGGSSSYNTPKASRLPIFKPSVPPYPTESYPVRSSPTPPATTSASDNQVLLKYERCFKIYLKCKKLETQCSWFFGTAMSDLSEQPKRHGLRLWPSGKSNKHNFNLLLLLPLNRSKHQTNFVSVLIQDLLRVWTRSSNVSDLPCTDPDKNKALLTSRPNQRPFSLVHLLTNSFGNLV